MKSKLCLPIKEKYLRDVFAMMADFESRVDLFEVWLDELEELDLGQIFANKRKKILVVNKNELEKGAWNGSEVSRIEILVQAAFLGADYVDVGLHTEKELISKVKNALTKGKLILSHHDFERTPQLDELKKKYKKARSYGADVFKCACLIEKDEDVFVLIDLIKFLHKENFPAVILPMGERAKFWRLVFMKLGNEFNFVAADEKRKTALGQISLDETENLGKEIFEW
jgi:3-dehydroquinate dehydratase-1